MEGNDTLRILISREEIAARVAQLGSAIAKDFAAEEITLVMVLQGAVTFARELARHLPLKISHDSVAVASYGAAAQSSRQPQLIQDLAQPIAGKNILIVEDILDSGFTMNFLATLLRGRHPKMLRVATLLDKPARRVVPFTADYVGFVIEDNFVVGYGLDFNQQYRELPDICILSPATASF